MDNSLLTQNGEWSIFDKILFDREISLSEQLDQGKQASHMPPARDRSKPWSRINKNIDPN